jgi:uncharacterized membrane protein (UPF0127 family)
MLFYISGMGTRMRNVVLYFRNGDTLTDCCFIFQVWRHAHGMLFYISGMRHAHGMLFYISEMATRSRNVVLYFRNCDTLTEFCFLFQELRHAHGMLFYISGTATRSRNVDVYFTEWGILLMLHP